MQNRIDRLEGLVLSLMTNGVQAPGVAAATKALNLTVGPSPDDMDENDDTIREEECEEEEERFAQRFGAMKVDKNEEKGMYVGDSHWHMVLADIAEVRNYFSTHKREVDAAYTRVNTAAPVSPTAPTLLLGAVPKASEAEIRNALPARAQIEALVNRFFLCLELDPAAKILHPPTFKKQLQAYYRDPAGQPMAWIALLFSALAIAMQSYGRCGDEPIEWVGRTKDMVFEYRRRTVQALVSSNYVMVRAHTLETLLLYALSEFISAMDISVGQWLVLGIITRLAIRAGYHRDGAQFKEMTPFAVEMRRRVWLFIRQCDILFSVGLALPHMINSRDCDTRLPLNIADDKLSVDSATLPNPEPDSVYTPMTYFLAKGRLAILLGQIIDETQGLSGRGATYNTILSLDAQLMKVVGNIPKFIMVRELEECLDDSPTLLLQRFYIDIMSAKIACVLHRRYVGLAHKDSRYELSRTRAVTAAMRLLELQSIIYNETKPGGRLPSIKWGITGMHRADFLLGAMIICLDLNTSETHGHPFIESSPPVVGKDGKTVSREDMIALLEGNLHIWEQQAETSMDTFKAKEIVKVMLGLVKQRATKPEPLSQLPPQTFSPSWARANAAAQGIAFTGPEGPEQAAAHTLGMLSSGMSPNTAAYFANGSTGLTPGASGASDFAMADGSYPSIDGQNPGIGSMFAGTGPGELSDNLDWAAWDRYMMQTSDTSAMETEPAFFGATGLTPGPLQDENFPLNAQQDRSGSGNGNGTVNPAFGFGFAYGP